MHIRAREDPRNAEVRKERAERERGFQGRREGRFYSFLLDYM